jgi:hypothetical protein
MSEHASPLSSPAETDKKARERSPNYPSIGLRRAIELAKIFWEHDRRQLVLVARAITNLGFGAKSSTGPLAISAMVKYGLFDTEGKGDTRRVRLTDLAISLLNPSSQNADQLLKQAALMPGIHTKLWEKFGADGASEGTIRDYLTFDLHFTEQAANALIEEYLDTIRFARLVEGDMLITTEQDEEPPELKQAENRNAGTKLPPAPAKPPMTGAIRYLPIPLDIGDAPIPIGMSEDDFQLLLDTLKLWKKKIVTDSAVKPLGAGDLAT